MALMVSPWGFRPQDVSIPVNLWWGEARFYAGEDHVSLIVNHTEEILSVLAER
jgi:hypothetical protein